MTTVKHTGSYEVRERLSRAREDYGSGHER